MKYLSLFSGVGGFEQGIAQAHDYLSGYAVHETEAKREGLGGQGDCLHAEHHVRPVCIGYSEIDKYATSIYRKHFPEHKAYGDITNIDPAALPHFDLICGGFPCQAFSIAGKRGGFEDTRGTLFFEICRLAEAKRPRVLLLENVKGLLSHDGGRTFSTIISTLNELGYDCQWQLLNGADWVPQNRERIVIVGHLRGTHRPEVFPLRRGDATNTPIGDLAFTLNARADSGIDAKHPQTLITHALDANYSNRVHSLQTRNPNRPSLQYSSGGSGPLSRADGFTYCVDTGNTQGVECGARIRRLTPLECERLMGLPDAWTAYGVNEAGETITISDTQRYKVCGNGIIPAMVRDVVIPLLDAHSPR
jgi:DNA (cytosine-5)-methyltransferase 1